MCGIVGIFGFTDKHLLFQMNNMIKHRGPDDYGYYIDDKICLGNRRLSIIDLKKGKQPIHNEDKTIWITFNGEIYNFNELKEKIQKNHKFYTNTDTETILHVYEEFGENFVKYLNGMFSFALWDSNKKTLFLVRDRIGIKPLYYTIIDGYILFSSEIKSLLQYKELERKIDFQSLYNYLSFRYVPGNKTILENIYRLEPGCMLICKLKKEKIEIKKKRYWSLNFDVKHNTKEFYINKIRKMLQTSVEMRLISDVKLGAYLSGGIDSSSVVAFMAKSLKDPVKTFTVGFGEETDELKYAKIISETFGTDHKELVVEVKNVPKELKNIVWYLDEPVADPAAIPTYFMSKVTKRYVTVLLTGEGADEQFAGYYQRYSLMSKKFLPFKKLIYKRLVSTFTERSKRHAIKLKNLKTFKTHIDFIKAEMPTYKFEMTDWLPNDLLLKVDRMTMAHSLEARVPYLDHNFVQFNLSIPMRFKIRKGTEKYILKEALKDILPKSIIERRKHSFSVPLSKWFKKENLLEPLYNSEFFKKEYIEKIKNKKPRQLYSMLIFELWYRIFILNEYH